MCWFCLAERDAEGPGVFFFFFLEIFGSGGHCCNAVHKYAEESPSALDLMSCLRIASNEVAAWGERGALLVLLRCS